MAGEFVGILLIWLVFNTILASVVSSHAKKNGLSGYFWIVFLFGIVGVLLYVADMAGSSQSDSNSKGRKNRGDLRTELYEENKTLKEEGAAVAVSAVYDYLTIEGEAKPEYFTERIYPVYPAGYDSKSEWWGDCISPELRSLSEVEPPTAERDTWAHLPTLERRKHQESQTDAGSVDENAGTASVDNWITSPDSDFMHQELGERGRGLYVRVTDGDKDGSFFVKGEGVKPESHTVEAKHGTDWVTDAVSYLERRYLTSSTR